MASLARVKCLQAIMIEVARRHGLDAFLTQRSENVVVPYLSEIADHHPVSPVSLRKAFESLQKKGILSTKLAHKHGYLMLKPKAFMNEIVSQALKFIGLARFFMLPPYLRSMPKVEQLQRLISMPQCAHGVVVMHSVFLINPQEGSPYKGARVLKAELPLSIALPKEAIDSLIQNANLVEVRLPKIEKGSLFPLGFTSSDLVIFEKKKLVKDLPSENKDERMQPIEALFNAILLKKHPVRGEEQSEALLQKILQKNLQVD